MSSERNLTNLLQTKMADSCAKVSSGLGHRCGHWALGAAGGFIVLTLIVFFILWIARPKWIVCNKCDVDWGKAIGLSALIAIVLILLFGGILSCLRKK